MKTTPRYGLLLVCVLALAGGTASAGDDRTEDEKAADTCIAQGMQKLKEAAEARPEDKQRLFHAACDLFARAVGHDAECDTRMFARLPDPRTRPERFLRAELHSMFARAFCAHETWDKALSNVDRAIQLHTVRESMYRQLKDEIIKRKNAAD